MDELVDTLTRTRPLPGLAAPSALLADP